MNSAETAETDADLFEENVRLFENGADSFMVIVAPNLGPVEDDCTVLEGDEGGQNGLAGLLDVLESEQGVLHKHLDKKKLLFQTAGTLRRTFSCGPGNCAPTTITQITSL